MPIWVCGSPNGTEVGSEAYRRPDLEKARALVRESGYRRRAVVLIGGADIPPINGSAWSPPICCKKIGINVDLQMSDWGSVAARRAKKDPPAQGGWNLFHTSANGAQLASPLTSPSTITTCDGKNFVGWPCDQEEEDMRHAIHPRDRSGQAEGLLEAMHRRLWEVVPYVPLGQFRQPFLWRKNVSGVLKANTLVLLEHRKGVTAIVPATLRREPEQWIWPANLRRALRQKIIWMPSPPTASITCSAIRAPTSHRSSKPSRARRGPTERCRDRWCTA